MAMPALYIAAFVLFITATGADGSCKATITKHAGRIPSRTSRGEYFGSSHTTDGPWCDWLSSVRTSADSDAILEDNIPNPRLYVSRSTTRDSVALSNRDPGMSLELSCLQASNLHAQRKPCRHRLRMLTLRGGQDDCEDHHSPTTESQGPLLHNGDIMTAHNKKKHKDTKNTVVSSKLTKNQPTLTLRGGKAHKLDGYEGVKPCEKPCVLEDPEGMVTSAQLMEYARFRTWARLKEEDLDIAVSDCVTYACVL